MAMINVKKKIEKKASSLGIDEPVLAACTTNPSGTMTRMLARDLGGAVGALVAERAVGSGDDSAADATGATAPDDGLAGRFPSGRHFLVLTESRLLLTDVSTMTGSPKNIVAQWDRRQVADIAVAGGKLADQLTIAFSDGTAVQIEGAKGTDPGSVAERFNG